MAPITKQLGIIGGGCMCTALLGGWVKGQLVSPENVTVSDPYAPALQKLEENLKVNTTHDNIEVVKKAEILMLAVKPQVLPKLMVSLQEYLRPDQLIISIAAGITVDQLKEYCFPAKKDICKIVRVMPNTPCLVGEGACGFCVTPTVSKEELEIVDLFLNGVGVAVQVEEKHIDAVSGLSGSGPAYVFIMIEALADGGVRCGLPRDVAMKLATQLVKGSAVMVQNTGKHPGELKDAVCSPGGATIAAVQELEERGFRAAALNAVIASANKCTELGKSK
eukprot:TRINITY_DN3914_c0_g1_i1.p2 TRINITY_DN3914_c0_g1~~TRINITY_DN3914_c0_g1_i1.p2  ORF type:complete len:278 (+),score=108.22 TRINITY_DN3914_c0_g1_i1:29-862(+)